jgi:hypothetical protein
MFAPVFNGAAKSPRLSRSMGNLLENALEFQS